MRRLGKVTHISHRGSLILRSEKTPPIGAQVVDKQVQPIGRVLDVFGPVRRPYLSVRPKKGIGAQNLVGQVLYLYKN
ncbi:H/ACA RNA-protein complex protein Gar1 [Candidatus Thorarchaeota archaeon]|nr:MAG: H/ACA RNA-protein complex protein Gar1 [Candidatus Thorarchaeota archaeon]